MKGLPACKLQKEKREKHVPNKSNTHAHQRSIPHGHESKVEHSHQRPKFPGGLDQVEYPLTPDLVDDGGESKAQGRCDEKKGRVHHEKADSLVDEDLAGDIEVVLGRRLLGFLGLLDLGLNYGRLPSPAAGRRRRVGKLVFEKVLPPVVDVALDEAKGRELEDATDVERGPGAAAGLPVLVDDLCREVCGALE